MIPSTSYISRERALRISNRTPTKLLRDPIDQRRGAHFFLPWIDPFQISPPCIFFHSKFVRKIDFFIIPLKISKERKDVNESDDVLIFVLSTVDGQYSATHARDGEGGDLGGPNMAEAILI